MGRRKINLNRVFADELVGLCEVDDRVWLVSFPDFDLGEPPRESRRLG